MLSRMLLPLCPTHMEGPLTSCLAVALKLHSAAPNPSLPPQTVVWISRRNLEGQSGDRYNSWQLQRMFRNEGEPWPSLPICTITQSVIFLNR